MYDFGTVPLGLAGLSRQFCFYSPQSRLTYLLQAILEVWRFLGALV